MVPSGPSTRAKVSGKGSGAALEKKLHSTLVTAASSWRRIAVKAS
jgi:hypothetical protein